MITVLSLAALGNSKLELKSYEVGHCSRPCQNGTLTAEIDRDCGNGQRYPNASQDCIVLECHGAARTRVNISVGDDRIVCYESVPAYTQTLDAAPEGCDETACDFCVSTNESDNFVALAGRHQGEESVVRLYLLYRTMYNTKKEGRKLNFRCATETESATCEVKLAVHGEYFPCNLTSDLTGRIFGSCAILDAWSSSAGYCHWEEQNIATNKTATFKTPFKSIETDSVFETAAGVCEFERPFPGKKGSYSYTLKYDEISLDPESCKLKVQDVGTVDVELNFCNSSPCQYGTCDSGLRVCVCPTGFTGPDCGDYTALLTWIVSGVVAAAALLIGCFFCRGAEKKPPPTPRQEVKPPEKESAVDRPGEAERTEESSEYEESTEETSDENRNALNLSGNSVLDRPEHLNQVSADIHTQLPAPDASEDVAWPAFEHQFPVCDTVTHQTLQHQLPPGDAMAQTAYTILRHQSQTCEVMDKAAQPDLQHQLSVFDTMAQTSYTPLQDQPSVRNDADDENVLPSVPNYADGRGVDVGGEGDEDARSRVRSAPASSTVVTKPVTKDITKDLSDSWSCRGAADTADAGLGDALYPGQRF